MIPLRFDHSLKQHLLNNFAGFEVDRNDQDDLRRAAVALVVVRSDRDPAANHIAWSEAERHEPAVILTRRAARMNKHAGQWALPGGRLDPGETAMEAALRELEEEVGLRLDPTHVIARLDDYPTRSGFVISPFVLWAEGDPELVANPDEVASIHRIPVRELMRPDSPTLLDSDDPKRPVLRLPIGDSWIAAPTAAVLYQFREVALAGNHVRVNHFDQPEFAWG